MPLTVRIKILRALSVIQCWLALWLIVLGIVEVARVKWRFSGLGMPIWTGVLVAFTGSFGVFFTLKKVQKSPGNVTIPQYLVMTLMGFSLTCGILSSMIMFSYGQELAAAGHRSFPYYSLNNYDNKDVVVVKAPLVVDSRFEEEHALVGSIFAFTLLELIAALWSAALCFVNDHKPTDKNEDFEVDPLMDSVGQSQQAGGASMLNV